AVPAQRAARPLWAAGRSCEDRRPGSACCGSSGSCGSCVRRHVGTAFRCPRSRSPPHEVDLGGWPAGCGQLRHPLGSSRSLLLSSSMFTSLNVRTRTCLTNRAGRYMSQTQDRKSTRLNSSHVKISYAVFCLKKKKNKPEE